MTPLLYPKGGCDSSPNLFPRPPPSTPYEMSRRVPTVVAVLVAGFLVTRATFFATTTASEYALYRDYAVAARQTSLAELYRTRDVEYPPLGVALGAVALRVADLLPENVDWL